MIRRWFINLFREVLAHELLSIHTLLGEVLMNQAKILASLESLQSSQQNSLVPESEDNSRGAGDQAPVQTSRGSWPRMKRHLEERDVRRVIAEQAASGDFQNAAEIASRMNEEAAKLEAYWRSKSASVRE